MKIDGLMFKYAAMLEQIDPDLADIWGNNHDHARKSKLDVTPDLVANFTAFEMGGLGFEFGNDFPDRKTIPDERPRPVLADPDFDAAYGARIQEILPRSIRHLSRFPFADPIQVAELLRWDGIAGGRSVAVRLETGPVRVSHHTLRVAWRAYEMRAHHGAWPKSLLEIGGGHGRFVRDVALCAPDATLYYSDLPFNLLVAAGYLARKFPGQVNLIWTREDRFKPEARITMIAPWRLGELPENVEICCNFLSFQHMSAANLGYYSTILEDRKVGALFHMNRNKALHGGETDLDQAPFNRCFEPVFDKEISGFVRANRRGGPPDDTTAVSTRLQYLRRRSG